MKRSDFLKVSGLATAGLVLSPTILLPSREYKEGMDFYDFARLCFRRGHRISEETDDTQLFRTIAEIGYSRHPSPWADKEIKRILALKRKEHLIMIGRSAILNRKGGIVEFWSGFCREEENPQCDGACKGCQFNQKVLNRLKYMHSAHELLGRSPRDSDGFYFEWLDEPINVFIGDTYWGTRRYTFTSNVRLCR